MLFKTAQMSLKASGSTQLWLEAQTWIWVRSRIIRTIFVHQWRTKESVWLICATQTIFGEPVTTRGLLHQRLGVSATLVVVFTFNRYSGSYGLFYSTCKRWIERASRGPGRRMLNVGLPSPTAQRMESRLSGDGKPPTSWCLGPALVFSILAVIVSCHGACRHRVPSPSEVNVR